MATGECLLFGQTALKTQFIDDFPQAKANNYVVQTLRRQNSATESPVGLKSTVIQSR